VIFVRPQLPVVTNREFFDLSGPLSYRTWAKTEEEKMIKHTHR
jgi:hypothetical protein